MSAARPHIGDIERALTELALASKELGADPARAGAHDRVVRLHQHALRLIQAYAMHSYATGLDMGRDSALSGDP